MAKKLYNVVVYSAKLLAVMAEDEGSAKKLGQEVCKEDPELFRGTPNWVHNVEEATEEAYESLLKFGINQFDGDPIWGQDDDTLTVGAYFNRLADQKIK